MYANKKLLSCLLIALALYIWLSIVSCPLASFLRGVEKKLRRFSENVQRFSENVQRFSENLPRFLEKLRRFLRKLREEWQISRE